MKIECEVETKAATMLGSPKIVKVTLEGDFDAIMELLQKLAFNPLAPDAPKIK